MWRRFTIGLIAAGLSVAACGKGDPTDGLVRDLSAAFRGAEWREPSSDDRVKGVALRLDGDRLEVVSRRCRQGEPKACDKDRSWAEERATLRLSRIDPGSVSVVAASGLVSAPEARGFRIAFACREAACQTPDDAAWLLCRNARVCEKAALSFKTLAVLSRTQAARTAAWGARAEDAERHVSAVSKRIKNESSTQVSANREIMKVTATGPARLRETGDILIPRKVCERTQEVACRKSAEDDWSVAGFLVHPADIDPKSLKIIAPEAGEEGHFVDVWCFSDRECVEIRSAAGSRPCKAEDCTSEEILERYGEDLAALVDFTNYRGDGPEAQLSLDCGTKARCEAVAKDLREVVTIAAAARRDGALAVIAAAGEDPASESAESLADAATALMRDAVASNARLIVVALSLSLEDPGLIKTSVRRCDREGELDADTRGCLEARGVMAHTAAAKAYELDPSGVKVAPMRAELGEAGLSISFSCWRNAACIDSGLASGARTQGPVSAFPCPDDAACAAIASGLRTLIVQAIGARLVALTKDYEYKTPLEGELPGVTSGVSLFSDDGIEGVAFRPGTGVLTIEIGDAALNRPSGRAEIPLARAQAGFASLDGAGPFDAISFACAPGESCISESSVQRTGGPVEEFKFGCRPEYCANVKQLIDALAALARMDADPRGSEQVRPAAASAQGGAIQSRIDALNALCQEIAYARADEEWGDELVTYRRAWRFSYDEARGLLQAATTGDWTTRSSEFGDERGEINETYELPMRRIAITEAPFTAAKTVPDGQSMRGLTLACDGSENCIPFTTPGDMTASGVAHSVPLAVPAGAAAAVRANLEALAAHARAIATARGPSHEAPAAAADGAEAILARLRAATADHVYRRGNADRSIGGFGHIAEKNRLWFAVRDHRHDAAFLEYEAPLDKVRFRTGESGDPNFVAIDCPRAEACIATYDGDGEFAGGAHNKDEFTQSVSGIGIGCRPDRCALIRADLERLAALARGDTAQPPAAVQQGRLDAGAASPQPVPARDIKRLGAAGARVNDRIDRAAAPVAGLPPTQGVAVLTDGKIALHTDSCAADRGGCGPNAVTDNEIVVAFAPDAIHASSIAIQSAGAGYAVVFSCKAGACIRSPDGRIQFAGYGLACRDQTACNRLVIDFASLLAAAER
jgi:hypothetical protein